MATRDKNRMHECYKRSQSNNLPNSNCLKTTLKAKESSSDFVTIYDKDDGCLHKDSRAVLKNSYDNHLNHDTVNVSSTIRQSIKDDRNVNSDIPVMFASTDFDDNSNSLTRIINVGTDGIPWDKNRDINIDSTKEGLTKFNHLCCKFLTALAVICVIGCFMMPIILYYINQTATAKVPVDPKFLITENTSNSKIIKVCNVSAVLYSYHAHQILHTYEALRTINLPSSQLYCTERVEMLFCDALMECSNESCVKDIVCQPIRQEYCTAEWRLLELAHNETDHLIDCEEYEETAPLNCGDQFGLINDGSVCLPLCEGFSQYSEAYTTPHLILIAASQFTSAIGGLIVVIASLSKRKKMLQFPQILIVMNAGILVIINFVVIIPTVSIGSWNMLCSSKFLFDAILNPTTFCKVQGCIISAGFVLYVYFWLLFASHLALKLLLPLKSAKLHDSDYSRMIYTTEVIVVILISILPPIISAILNKYSIVVFPPTYCLLEDPLYCLIVTIIPVMAGSCACIVLMILILYKLHMHYGIFKRMQEKSTGKQVCTCQFTVPEVKIVFVLVYWLVITTALFTSVSIKAGRADMFYYHIKRYIGCMAGGHRKHLDCHSLRQDFEAGVNPTLEIIYLLFVAFLNFSSIPFVIQFRTVKRLINRLGSSILTKLETGSKSQTM